MKSASDKDLPAHVQLPEDSDEDKPQPTKRLMGLLFGFGAATCYGLLICSVKWLYRISNITVFEILYLRSFVAMVLVVIILRTYGVSPFDIKRPVAWYLSVRCITGFFGFAAEFFAAKFTDLSKVVIILYNPFLTSLMSFLIIGERVTRHDLLSFLLGVIGIALLTDPFSNLKGLEDLVGCGLALLSAVIFNVGFIALRKVKRDLDSWQIVFYFTVTNMLLSPFSFMAEQALDRTPTVYEFEGQSLAIVFLIGVLTVLGNFCVNKTLFYEKAGRATAYYNLELLYTFLFDVLVSRSRFSVSETSGVLLIVAANLYMYLV
jgi:drug/metabolite transporter (DMT)-like permease